VRRARRNPGLRRLAGPWEGPGRLQLGGAGPGSPTTVGGVGITIRPVRSGEHYAAWRQVLLTVEPGERAPTADELRAQAGPQQRFSWPSWTAGWPATRALAPMDPSSSLARPALVRAQRPRCGRTGEGCVVQLLINVDENGAVFNLACVNRDGAGGKRTDGLAGGQVVA
jgi:hypothetical protein